MRLLAVALILIGLPNRAAGERSQWSKLEKCRMVMAIVEKLKDDAGKYAEWFSIKSGRQIVGVICKQPKIKGSVDYTLCSPMFQEERALCGSGVEVWKGPKHKGGDTFLLSLSLERVERGALFNVNLLFLPIKETLPGAVVGRGTNGIVSRVGGKMRVMVYDSSKEVDI